jgi:hypothetical protein
MKMVKLKKLLPLKIRIEQPNEKSQEPDPHGTPINRRGNPAATYLSSLTNTINTLSKHSLPQVDPIFYTPR